ncbi:transketolase [Clostridia bacterium]|nr:transketolase [Clostridia bacterium]
MSNIDVVSTNTLRFLSADAVQKANSGHPGLPLGAAPAAYALWAKFLSHNPENPNWVNRDRFVLSAGHGSSLLYSLLTLFGYGLSVEDLKNFRQEGSLTPGHPEYKHTKGIEVTTGPLGQGIANAVGFAIAENHLGAEFNRDIKIVDHYTYCLCGDGCLMEGISHEAASLAGTLSLNKLIILYDSNGITIEGSTQIAFKENVRERFNAYGFNTILVKDGNDIEEIAAAIAAAKKSDKPTLIEVKSIIGYGAPNKQGKQSAHGEPLGAEELAAAKTNLEFPADKDFYIPAEVSAHIEKLKETFRKYESDWNNTYKEYADKYPELAKQWNERQNGVLPDLLNNEDFWKYEGNIATRISSETVLNKLATIVPALFGGSADLAPSTKTLMKGAGDYSAETPAGRNVHYGIREHAMTAIANAIALHGGLIPYVSGFFIFSDYAKPSIRLSGLMGLRVINVLTHDSIGVGEDGPTHQPIEQLASLRSIPNVTVIRPCDTNETAAAWYIALNSTDSPTAIVLTRQNLPLLKETGKGALKGAYILKDSKKPEPDVILIASGSEVSLIYDAYDVLQGEGIDARVVSFPSWEVFEKQSDEYKESVLPKNVRKRVAVEALSSFGWERYTGLDGAVISIDHFGESAPADKLFKKFGFTTERVVEEARKLCR